jgi:tetratricopeptide (TPR) repeat protein
VVACLILAGIVWAFSSWKGIKDFPGIPSLTDLFYDYFYQESIPLADPKRFSLALAHLEHDKDGHYERFIREALKDFTGEGAESTQGKTEDVQPSIQLFQYGKTISLEGPEPEERERAGHAAARQYLEKSGADALLWGMVHHIGSQSALRLYWTTSRYARRAKEPYLAENFKLPILFWADFVEVLRLVVVTHHVAFRAQEGRFIANKLDPFIATVRRLVNRSPGQAGWNPENRTQVMYILATSLSLFGQQTGKNQPLEEAIGFYLEALKAWTRERVPLNYAMAQNSLGIALAHLGEREAGTTRLMAAVDAFREALKERTREQVPLQWASTQNGLGAALMHLGEREAGTQRLEEAVAAFQEALKAWTREQVPLNWAKTQHNGVAISTLDLFRAAKALQPLDYEAIRQSIKSTQGRWTVDSYVSGHRKRERIGPDKRLAETDTA